MDSRCMNNALDQDEFLREADTPQPLKEEICEDEYLAEDETEVDVASEPESRQSHFQTAYEEIERKGSVDLIDFFKTYGLFIGFSFSLIIVTISLSYYTNSLHKVVDEKSSEIRGLNISSQSYWMSAVEAEQVLSVRRQVENLGLNLVTMPRAPYQMEDKRRDSIASK